MITLDFSELKLNLKTDGGKTMVFDPIRKKWLVLTPEEHVRQYILACLLLRLGYPAALIAVEKQIKLGTRTKRFDIVVYSPAHEPWMLVECKAPEVPVTEATLHQLLNYQQQLQCRYWLLTNGHQTFCADALHGEAIKWLHLLPAYNS